MTAPDPDKQRLRWVEDEAGVNDDDLDREELGWEEPDRLDWWDR